MKQLARTQRYLGLREVDLVDGMKPAEGLKNPDIDVSKPAPFAFERNVVFAAIDLEWYERNSGMVTEIGISTLDTADLEGLPPGDEAANWFSQIKARHFRVREHSDKVNKDFIVGCPDRFETTLGTSEWVSILDAGALVTECLQTPLKKRFATGRESPLGMSTRITHRPVIVVGHDPTSDFAALRNTGLHLASIAHLLEVLDTAEIYVALKHDVSPSTPALANVLYDMDITGWNLHNAVCSHPFPLRSPPYP